MSAQADTILQQLDETRQRWWLYSFLCGSVLTVCVSGAALLLFVLFDAWLKLSTLGLLILLAAWLVLSSGLFVGLIYRVLHRQRSLPAAARRVELALPKLGSSLINLVQLSDQQPQGSRGAFVQAAMSQAAVQAGSVPFGHAAAQHTRWNRIRLGLQTSRDLTEYCGALAVLVVLFVILQAALPQWSSCTLRLMQPWKFVPQVGEVRIVEVLPGNTDVLIGSPLEFTVRIENPDRRPYVATLYSSTRGNEEAAQPMLADDTGERFVCSLPSVIETLEYRVEVGDSQSERYTARVVRPPAIEEVQVTYDFPTYLNRSSQTVQQRLGDLEAPQYTLARLQIRGSLPLSRGHLQVDGRTSSGRVSEDRRTLEAQLLLSKAGEYSIHLFNASGHGEPQPRLNSIRVLPDAPPTVQLLKPGSETSTAPGSQLPILLRAADDYGLGQVRLEIKPLAEEGQERAPRVLNRWDKLHAATSATLSHELTLKPEEFQPGQTWLLRGVAVDRRSIDQNGVNLKPQESATPWHRLRLVDPQEKSAETLAQLDSLRARLYAILQTQIQARELSARVRSESAPEAALRLAVELPVRQTKVQTATVELAGTIQSQEQAQTEIKRALGQLAQGDMLDAVRQAEALTRSGKAPQPEETLATLTATQERIIDALRRMLDTARRATAEELAQMPDRPGGDLPDAVQDKLRDLKEKLQEFLKHQNRVIEASENLAKMPVEDFTEKEEQLLKELAASQDDWSRFMQEAHTDLSKLPEQDFSNPSLLQELVEVETELKMAEDALTKKTAEIAVPLEQLGAEMAEELVTNIEKWLPDTPDRERWSQEEPLADDMKQAPLAELPGELEDLVGELMEEEEDLFDEMEDASSSWADSIDKGAGWDAMDGPISNNSAKGVTGNRLPNTSEIAGRSGEGRQGKASGEFVGDSAVGKGGRKTPSRLTSDPQLEGQVKDTSKDPVGGATGGGKESGQGGEGLEGPVPNRPERELARLAGKQATLRNRAESIDLQFQVLRYHHTDLKKLIEQMAAVERDLRSGNYRSALRSREVLVDGLANIKTYLDGEFQVRSDQSANVPAEIQKEILNGLQDVSPSGWEELNRRYFEQLAKGGGKPAQTATKPDME